MIKLTDLFNLNNMKYSDKVKPKHQKKIDMVTELIADDITIQIQPFPENSSKETKSELQWLLDYNDGKINQKEIESGDNVLETFEKYCDDNKLKFNKTYYKQILKESVKTILSLKYYYNRPRPYQLGEFYGIKDFKIHNLDSAKTPSYPSGHTTQGCLVAELLGREYPNHYDNFKELATFVSNSRLMARAHYPSDISFGMEVAQHLLGKVIQKKND